MNGLPLQQHKPREAGNLHVHPGSWGRPLGSAGGPLSPHSGPSRPPSTHPVWGSTLCSCACFLGAPPEAIHKSHNYKLIAAALPIPSSVNSIFTCPNTWYHCHYATPVFGIFNVHTDVDLHATAHRDLCKRVCTESWLLANSMTLWQQALWQPPD